MFKQTGQLKNLSRKKQQPSLTNQLVHKYLSQVISFKVQFPTHSPPSTHFGIQKSYMMHIHVYVDNSISEL